jgi:hypothetical protein
VYGALQSDLLNVISVGLEWDCRAFLNILDVFAEHRIRKMFKVFHICIQFLVPHNEIEPKKVISKIFCGNTTEELKPKFHV